MELAVEQEAVAEDALTSGAGLLSDSLAGVVAGGRQDLDPGQASVLDAEFGEEQRRRG